MEKFPIPEKQDIFRVIEIFAKARLCPYCWSVRNKRRD